MKKFARTLGVSMLSSKVAFHISVLFVGGCENTDRQHAEIEGQKTAELHRAARVE
jgi:hypothetical protein